VENRLIQLVVNSTFEVSDAGAPDALNLGTYKYQYDYRTRRVLRDESGANGNVTSVIFSGGTSVQEVENSGITVQYVRGSDYGGGIGGILYTLRNGVPSYTHYNSRGDVVAKTNSTGAITYEALYEAYGKRTVETGATLDRQKANTKDEDPTGLLDEGFRYRDLDTGVFLTKDPLGFVDGPNEYTYVIDNPWTHFDPEGLDTDDQLHQKQQSKQAEVNSARESAKNALTPAARKADEKQADKLQGQLDKINDRISKLENSAKALKDVASLLSEKTGDHNEGDNAIAAKLEAKAGSLDDVKDAGLVTSLNVLGTAINIANNPAVQVASLFFGVGEVKAEASLYSEITNVGSRVANRGTDVTKAEFEKNLTESGFVKTVSKDGKATILEKDGSRYVLRDQAKSTGGPTADFYKSGSQSTDLKIRLKP
jgi:RHS repeat-associated protein